ncbi:Octopamine receptor 1 [Dissostichus eleginoides]|uniref:Octopamine receptor 1 n=1 Tax=Dissostichus eleginoides TaxID=100907 RepID=A0AAD9FG46_DISEL|nr:Octopamine receptor 1 [Dissostichus eleginoides]
MYTSLLNVKQAISVERKLIDYLKTYIDHESERLEDVKRHFLDNSRYILFAYMLINDTLQLLSSVILFLLVIGLVTFPTVYCVPLLLLSTSTFMNTTLILATMSLERYVAIIYPLQCPAAWRSDRIWIIILSIWFLSFIFPMIEYSIGERDPAVDILSTPVLCQPIYINLSPIQGFCRFLDHHH